MMLFHYYVTSCSNLISGSIIYMYMYLLSHFCYARINPILGYHSDDSATPSPYAGHKYKRHKGESKQKHKKKKSKKKHKHKRSSRDQQLVDVETIDS